MTVTVAIASEYDGCDGVIYERLLSLLLNVPVTRWTGNMVFNGYRSVAKQAHAFLNAAANAGVRHALLAIDNDGGGNGPAEHHGSCVPPTFNIDEGLGCRECWLTSALPPAWIPNAHLAVAVPVQTLETWLIALHGTALNAPTPEQYYGRRALKAHFYGRPTPNQAGRISQALAALQRPDVVATLSQRPSFQRLRERIAQWTVP